MGLVNGRYFCNQKEGPASKFRQPCGAQMPQPNWMYESSTVDVVYSDVRFSSSLTARRVLRSACNSSYVILQQSRQRDLLAQCYSPCISVGPRDYPPMVRGLSETSILLISLGGRSSLSRELDGDLALTIPDCYPRNIRSIFGRSIRSIQEP
jgi:hypothetical protein